MMTNETSFWDFKGIDEYSDNKFLMSSPYPVTFILISYLWFVLNFGPNYMKSRPPLNLRNWLVTYNTLQVLIAVYCAVEGGKYVWRYGLWHSTCIVDKCIQKRHLFIDGSHYYFLTKVIELLDTVFFVLRKKQRQVSFLHVYHHTLMVAAVWLITKYSRTDALVFLATINCWVHVVMYAYYALSAYPQLAKYLWWKKYITMMQLIQFVMMFIHVVISHYVSECRPAYYLLSSVCINTIFFMYLFGKFYIKSYNMKRYKEKTIENYDKISSSTSSKINSKNDLLGVSSASHLPRQRA